jgi:transaldolase/glucose-6-phosphate isomerase
MRVETAEVVERIWAREATVWTGGDESRWLGWLDEPARMLERTPELEEFAEDARAQFSHVVLLGMGGSSLAPEVLRRSFGSDSLHVLDTTHPRAIRTLEERLPLDETLFVSASKSGSTLETRSHTDYFWERVGRRGDAFIAVTDPGSELEAAAGERGFRRVFHGEPTIGGRYSALSPFGLVPAALMGIDVERLLARAEEMRRACRASDDNPGLELGTTLGRGWQEGRDKVVLAPNPGGFVLWVEQLLAESTGKGGKGLVPVAADYAAGGADEQEARVEVDDPYDLGAEFFRWEFATAVAGSLLGLNPFDQPNVQEAKDRTGALLESGAEPDVEPQGSIDELLEQAAEADYVCVQAFVEPTAEAERRLDGLARELRDRSGRPVTWGFGPRYLHSTGQLHKGGAANGLFLQILDDVGEEIPIPGRRFGFAELFRAQAAGDYEALRERGRRVARVHWKEM